LAIPLIVLPLVAFGRWVRRLSRNAQDTLANASAYASELVGAIRAVQAYTGEKLAKARFGKEVEGAYEAARISTQARAVLTAIIIFIVFTSVVAILWVGSHDVLTGAISPGRLGQFVLYAAFAAAGLGQLSEVWGEGSAASGAAERLFEILRVKSAITAPAAPRAPPQPSRGGGGLGSVHFALPPPAGAAAGGRRIVLGAPGRKGRDRRSIGRRQEHAVSSAAALLRSGFRHGLARWRPDQGGRSARSAKAHRAGAPGVGGVRRQRPREYPLWPARGHQRRGRTGGRTGARRRVHPKAARWFRHATRRARRHPVWGPAPAHRDCTRDSARCAAIVARRGDVFARRGIRNAGADGAGGIDASPHDAGDRASACYRVVLRPHPGDGSGPHRGAGQSRLAGGGRRTLRTA